MLLDIRLINDLEEISLDSKEQLDRIENAYNSLTSSEKSRVTNYDVYLQAKKKYVEILTESTKDDPTREITLNDLNGTWESRTYVWTIGTIDKAQAVLFSVYNKTTSSGGMGGVIPSNKLNSSVRVGYNVLTQRMEFRLFYYYQIDSEYLDVTAKDDGNGSITLYYQDETFTKNK